MNFFDKNIISEPSSTWKKILFLILVLFMGKGCNYFIEIDPRVNIIGTLLLLVPLFWVIAKEKKYKIEGNKIFAVIAVYLIWYSYHLFADIESPLYQGLKFLSLLFFAYVTVKHYSYHIAEYFEHIVVRLTLLALVLWFVEIVIGPATMGAMAPFDNYMHIYSKSFGLYSVITIFDAQTAFLGLPRNCGFCWEPGQFASLIVLALTFNLLRRNDRILNSKNFLILVLGLISTFSTTGFVTFAVLIFLKTIFAKVSVLQRIAYSVLLIVVFLTAMDLPFMREKIERHADVDLFFSNSSNVFIGEAGHRTVERFEGMYLSWLNLQEKPWLGFGPNNGNSLTAREYPMLVISNGNIYPIAMLGILIGVSFFFLLYKGTRRLSGFLGNENKYILFLVIMMFSVSYNYMYDIIMIAIAFLSFNRHDEQRYA